MRLAKFLVIWLLLLIMSACGTTESSQPTQPIQPEETKSADTPQEIVLSTTTSTQDSGLLDAILPPFEQSTGIKVKVVAVGTGQAIQLGKDGNADVIFVHAREAEVQFVADGYGINAYDVMYNQFLVIGPENDPAGIKGMASVTEAFKKIAETGSTFISRGDDSGTHKKELSVWKKAELKPEGDWYLSTGQGMGATLQMADEKGAYTLIDEATYLAQPSNLKVLFEGDQALFNPYGIIQVKSTSKPELAEKLINYIVSEETQKLIGEFGKDKYGKGLFVPSVQKRP
ncbi:extracellular solute-binding protein [Ammoniphilus sp. 3BR4]|uniref:extracellular solute-binding protein n=1 Tax=Ammoniphilus sp. 3BR4 TaxID=3158265 RepID=UPI00346793A8